MLYKLHNGHTRHLTCMHMHMFVSARASVGVLPSLRGDFSSSTSSVSISKSSKFFPTSHILLLTPSAYSLEASVLVARPLFDSFLSADFDEKQEAFDDQHTDFDYQQEAFGKQDEAYETSRWRPRCEFFIRMCTVVPGAYCCQQ